MTTPVIVAIGLAVLLVGILLYVFVKHITYSRTDKYSIPHKNNLATDRYSTLIHMITESLRLPVIESAYLSILATAFFCTVDYFCMRVLWNSVSSETSPHMVSVITLAAAAVLDVPPAISAYIAKKATQGMMSKRVAKAINVAAFSVVGLIFICQAVFRVVTKDIAFSYNDTGSLVNNLSSGSTELTANPQSNGIVITAALFSAMIPLATSIASYVIAFLTSNPLNDAIKRSRTIIVKIESNIIDLDQTQAEIIDLKYTIQRMIASDQDQYSAAVNVVRSQADERKGTVRTEMIRRLPPDEARHIGESNIILYDERVYELHTDAKLIKTINKYLGDDVDIADEPVASTYVYNTAKDTVDSEAYDTEHAEDDVDEAEKPIIMAISDKTA